MGRSNDTALRIMLDPELKGLKELRAGLVKAVTESTTVFSKKMVMGTKDNLQKQLKAAEKAALKVAALNHVLATKSFDEEKKRRIQASLAEAKIKSREAEKLFKQELKHEQRIITRRQKSMAKILTSQEASKAAGAAGAAFGESIADAFDDFMSKDVAKMAGGLFKRVGSGTQKLGEGLSKKAATDSVLGKMGGMMAKMGPAIAAIGALALGFGALIKMVFDADAHMKGLNKAMLEGGTVANDLVDKYGMLGPTLNKISLHFANARNLAVEFGIKAEESMKILSAYGEANQGLAKLTAGIKDQTQAMTRLETATIRAVAYSRLFGMESTEMATHFAEYMTNLGYTLEGVQEKFSGIALAARDSGFSTKRFTGILLQATSGMAQYNVRLLETADLLTMLMQTLGEKEGGDLLGRLAGGNKGQDTSTLTKQVLLMTEEKTRDILLKDSARAASDFISKVKDFESSTGSVAISKALSAAGLSMEMTGDEFSTALDKLPLAIANALQAQIKAENMGLGSTFTGVREVSQARSGGMGGLVAGLRGAGVSANLAMDFIKAFGALGKDLNAVNKKDIGEMIALEGLAGFSREELTQVQTVGADFLGRIETLERMSSLAKGGTAEGAAQVTTFNATTAKKWGIFIDEAGRWFKGKQGAWTENESDKVYLDEKSLTEMIMAAGSALDKVSEDDVNESLMLAAEVVDATRSIGDILSDQIDGTLTKIFSTISQLLAWFMGSGDEDVREKVQLLMDQNTILMESIGAEIGAQRGKVGGLRSSLRTAKGEDRVRIQRELEEETRVLEGLREKQKVAKGTVQGLRGVRSQEDAERLLGHDLDDGWFDLIDPEMDAEELQKVLAQHVKQKLQDSRWEDLSPERRKALTAGGRQQVMSTAEAVASSGTKRQYMHGGYQTIDRGEFQRANPDYFESIGEEKARQMAKARLAAENTGQAQPGVPGLYMDRYGYPSSALSPGGTTLLPEQAPITEKQAQQMQLDADERRKKDALEAARKAEKHEETENDRVMKREEARLKDAQLSLILGVLGNDSTPTARMAAAKALLAGDASGLPPEVRKRLLDNPRVGELGSTSVMALQGGAYGARVEGPPPGATGATRPWSSTSRVNVNHFYQGTPTAQQLEIQAEAFRK